MKMRLNIYFVFIIVIALFFTLPAFGSNTSDAKEIERILNDYGKDEVIELIREKRYGAITTTHDNEYYGRPRKDLVTTKTILIDLKILNLNTKAFEKALNKHLIKKEKKEQQLISNYNRAKSSSASNISTGNMADIKNRISRELQLSSGYSEYKQRQLLTRISDTAKAISHKQNLGLNTDDLQTKMSALNELYDELSNMEVNEFNQKNEKWAEEFRKSIKSRHLK